MAESAAAVKKAARGQLRAQCRRDKESKIFGELSHLLPVNTATKKDKLTVLRLTLAYIKLRRGLTAGDETARIEKLLQECGASTSLPSTPAAACPTVDALDEQLPPIAVIDNNGNVIAGALSDQKSTKKEPEIHLPEKVLTRLQEEFLADNPEGNNEPADSQSRTEKLQKYKEGLERGMQDFFSQTIPDNILKENAARSTNVPSLGPSQKHRNGITSNADTGKPNQLDDGYDESLGDGENNGSLMKEEQPTRTFPELPSETSVFLDAAPGFFISLDRDMMILYVSENVTQFLGYSQNYIIGQDVSDFVHDKDFKELERQMDAAQFQGEPWKPPKSWHTRRTFYVAMKFSFQRANSRSRDVGYTLYQWNARLRLCRDKYTGHIRVRGLVSLCRPAQCDTILTCDTVTNSFVARYSMGMKVLYCEPGVEQLMGYAPEELIGLSAYVFTHPSDLLMCEHSHYKVLKEGKADSRYCRAMSKNGSWLWTFSQITLSYDRTGKPQCISTRSFLVSKEEAERVLSREKEEYEKMKCFDFSQDTVTGDLSEPTLTSIAAVKELKDKKLRCSDAISSVAQISCQSSKVFKRSHRAAHKDSKDKPKTDPTYIKASPDMNESGPRINKLSSRTRKANPRKNKPSPLVSKVSRTMGKRSSSMGKASAKVSEPSPRMGKASPSMSEANLNVSKITSSTSKPSPRTGSCISKTTPIMSKQSPHFNTSKTSPNMNKPSSGTENLYVNKANPSMGIPSVCFCQDNGRADKSLQSEPLTKDPNWDTKTPEKGELTCRDDPKGDDNSTPAHTEMLDEMAFACSPEDLFFPDIHHSAEFTVSSVQSSCADTTYYDIDSIAQDSLSQTNHSRGNSLPPSVETMPPSAPCPAFNETSLMSKAMVLGEDIFGPMATEPCPNTTYDQHAQLKPESSPSMKTIYSTANAEELHNKDTCGICRQQTKASDSFILDSARGPIPDSSTKTSPGSSNDDMSVNEDSCVYIRDLYSPVPAVTSSPRTHCPFLNAVNIPSTSSSAPQQAPLAMASRCPYIARLVSQVKVNNSAMANHEQNNMRRTDYSTSTMGSKFSLLHKMLTKPHSNLGDLYTKSHPADNIGNARLPQQLTTYQHVNRTRFAQVPQYFTNKAPYNSNSHDMSNGVALDNYIMHPSGATLNKRSRNCSFQPEMIAPFSRGTNWGQVQNTDISSTMTLWDSDQAQTSAFCHGTFKPYLSSAKNTACRNGSVEGQIHGIAPNGHCNGHYSGHQSRPPQPCPPAEASSMSKTPDDLANLELDNTIIKDLGHNLLIYL